MGVLLSNIMLTIDSLSKISESQLSDLYLKPPLLSSQPRILSDCRYWHDLENIPINEFDIKIALASQSPEELTRWAALLYKRGKIKFYLCFKEILKQFSSGDISDQYIYAWLKPVDLYWCAARHDACVANTVLQEDINRINGIQVEVGGHLFSPLSENTEVLDKIMKERGFRTLTEIASNDMPFMVHTGIQSGHDFFDLWLERKVVEYAQRYIYNRQLSQEAIDDGGDISLTTAVKLVIFSELKRDYKQKTYEQLLETYEMYIRADLAGIWSKNRSEVICTASGAYAEFLANYRAHRRMWGEAGLVQ